MTALKLPHPSPPTAKSAKRKACEIIGRQQDNGDPEVGCCWKNPFSLFPTDRMELAKLFPSADAQCSDCQCFHFASSFDARGHTIALRAAAAVIRSTSTCEVWSLEALLLLDDIRKMSATIASFRWLTLVGGMLERQILRQKMR